MSHLIICLGKDSAQQVVNIAKHFDNVYVISEIENVPSFAARQGQKISMMLMPVMDTAELSAALFEELKLQLSKDKIVDLDIALNISSGSGKLHSAVIASVMKLGYGIRLVDQKDGKIIEL